MDLNNSRKEQMQFLMNNSSKTVKHQEWNLNRKYQSITRIPAVIFPRYPRKSKHKHNYKECLLRYESNYFGKNNIHTRLSSYCSICGKIDEKLKDSIVKDYHRTGMLSNGIKYHFIISGYELFEEYKDKLPVFHIDDDMIRGYVNLEENNKVNRE